MDTARVPIVREPLRAERRKEYKFFVPMTWHYGKSDYSADVRFFKTEDYEYNGFHNEGTWYIAVKNHQSKYAETRLTFEGVKDLIRKLTKVHYLMNPENEGKMLPTDDEGNVQEEAAPESLGEEAAESES
jgi:hypothetical protein